LLFTNVREKASLAYDIHSSYNSLAGMLTVQAGIDPQNLEKVSKTIAEQLHQAVGGHYSDDLLAGVKRSMIDQHRSQSDYLATVVERRYFAEISGIDISDEQWEDSVNQISKADISKVADQVDIQAEYVLESQEAADEDD
jgi:predicted Zn-dependent peptidase